MKVSGAGIEKNRQDTSDRVRVEDYLLEGYIKAAFRVNVC